MIKLEHVVLPSPEQMEFVIEGMRNPMNSWEKSDSNICTDLRPNKIECQACYYFDLKNSKCNEAGYFVGPNDLTLMQKLSKAGTDHRKFMRMMPVMVRITAPLYWWKEFDTYKVGTVANSCSTMHKITEKEFTLEDFSYEHLINDVSDSGNILDNIFARNEIGCIISTLNAARKKYLKTNDKKYWWQLIQLLPSSYNQTRNVMLNYEVLANIYHSRKGHKLDEWREFCEWIETLPYSEIITG